MESYGCCGCSNKWRTTTTFTLLLHPERLQMVRSNEVVFRILCAIADSLPAAEFSRWVITVQISSMFVCQVFVPPFLITLAFSFVLTLFIL